MTWTLNKKSIEYFLKHNLYVFVSSRKRRGFFTVSQTVRVDPPSSPPFGQLFVISFDLRLWLCALRWNLNKKKVIFIQLQKSPIPPYCRCYSVTKWVDSDIYEKCIFETHQNETKRVLSNKESNVNAKMGQNFHICLQSGLSGLIPPPLTVILTITRQFFTSPFNKSDENFIHKGMLPRSRTIKLKTVVFLVEI